METSAAPGRERARALRRGPAWLTDLRHHGVVRQGAPWKRRTAGSSPTAGCVMNYTELELGEQGIRTGDEPGYGADGHLGRHLLRNVWKRRLIIAWHHHAVNNEHFGR